VNTINDEKTKLLVNAMPKEDRLSAIRASFSGVMVLHLYRNLMN